MLAVVTIWLCFSMVIVPGYSGKRRQTESLLVFKQSGDIILHGLYPIRKRLGTGFGLNFEGVLWMGAMVDRIDQINQEQLLPGNLTLGYSIRDTGGDIQNGLRQTLSVLNEVVNKVGPQESKPLHIPIILGPVTDELEEKSENLYKLFDVPRIAYTTTSTRFSLHNEKIIRTVPSDFIHVEALLRLLSEMKTFEFSVVVSKSNFWRQRANVFQSVLKETNSRIKLREIIYVYKDEIDVSVVHQRISSKAVIIFAESNISTSLIQNGKVSNIWVEVCQFDDPLLRVFDTFGKLTKKIIIRNMRTNNADQFRSGLAATLQDSGQFIKPNWLISVYEKYCAKSKLSARNVSRFNEECERFRERIISAIGHQNEFNSSLTLQGVIDATNLIITSLKDTLKQCGDSTPRDCLKSSRSALVEKLRQTTSSNQVKNEYSIQLLRIVRNPIKLGRRTKMNRGWMFKIVREWLISGSDVEDKLRAYWNNKTNQNNLISASDLLINGVMNSSKNDTCKHCANNQSNCVPDNVIISWTDSWAIALYFLESICLLAVLSTFIYFSQHKNSPIMILCYSWPDNVILGVLCLFSMLPMMHIGDMTSYRCNMLWPIVNIVFAFYAGLLLTKTLFVQNLLKCEVATERPGRRMIFTMLMTLIQIVVLANLFVFDYSRTAYHACTSRGTVALFNIEGNIVIIVSMAFNWLLLCILFVLSVTETLKQRQNFCRTENLVAVATVAWLSYTCMISLAYFNIYVKYYLIITLIQCVIYLVNLAVCLGLVYVPTLRLVSTWLRQHTRQQKNLTSIKRAQAMSSKRQSSEPVRASLFDGNFSTEHLTIPSARHSGYYFDLRPASAVTDMSYPTSLVRSVHEQTHVVFGYGRRGSMSLNGATSVESVPSVDWLQTPSQAHSASSSYDNLSRAAEETADELTPQELLHEISTYWERHRSSDVIANGQYEDNIETNKWPSLEKLRTSDL